MTGFIVLRPDGTLLERTFAPTIEGVLARHFEVGSWQAFDRAGYRIVPWVVSELTKGPVEWRNET